MPQAQHILSTLFEVPIAAETLAPDQAPAALHPEEEAALGQVSARRRWEFAAGRTCARRALARLGRAHTALLPGPDRAPLWPEGCVGTITHSRSGCLVAVAHSAHAAALGLDFEDLGRLSERHWRTVLTPEEATRLRAHGAEDRDLLGTVAFSAKEALYKCWRPVTGEWLGFQEAEIDFLPHSRRNGEFRARVLREDLAGFPARLHGRWHREGDAIVTALCVTPLDLGLEVAVA